MSLLSDSMRELENSTPSTIPGDSWYAIRVDGRAFHTWTRDLQRPYDERLQCWMDDAAEMLCKEIPGAVLAYTQSDECSVIVSPGKEQAQHWFGGRTMKIASVAASIYTAAFNSHTAPRPAAHFDGRVVQLPTRHEVEEYLLWRQFDCQRNSVAMAAQSIYSHKELLNKSVVEQLNLLKEKGIVWQEYPARFKWGGLIDFETVFGITDFTHGRTGETETASFVRRKWLTGFALPPSRENIRAYLE